MGGGTCDLGIFEHGAIGHVATLSVGGDHFTNDIAVGLRTPMPEAERLKKRHGCALSTLVEEDASIEVASVGGRKPRMLSLQVLSEIIQPRAEEIFGLLRDEIERQKSAAALMARASSAREEGLNEKLRTAEAERDTAIAQAAERVAAAEAAAAEASASASAQTTQLRSHNSALLKESDAARAEAESLQQFRADSDATRTSLADAIAAKEAAEASAVGQRYISAATNPTWSLMVKIRQACAEGRADDAERFYDEFDFSRFDISDTNIQWLALQTLGRAAEARELLRPLDHPDMLVRLAGLLTYLHFDPTPYPNLSKRLEQQGALPRTVVPLNFACKRD